jgi:hypothetical protein
MKNHVSDAELMRQLLNSIANPKATRLYESVALQEEQVILETERQVQETLIPAFHAVFESYKGQLQEADAQGYTDEELLALAKKFPNIQDLIAAHANLRDEPATQDVDKDSALRTLKGAAETIFNKTQSSDPLVSNPEAWVANREDRLQQSLSKADPKGKYKKLGAIFQKLSKVVKNHPKKANAVVALMGVSIPILASGYWWAAPATLILTKTVTDMLNGSSFKSAVRKNITFAAIGAAIGGAIRYSDAIANTLDSLTGEATSSQGAINRDRSSQNDPEIGTGTGTQDDDDDGQDQPTDVNWDISMGKNYVAKGGESIMDIFDASQYKKNLLALRYDVDEVYEMFRRDLSIPAGQEFASPGQSFRMISPGFADDDATDSTDWGTENAPLSGDMETTSLADSSYLSRVRQLLGKDIPSMGGNSFGDAFKQAREDMGGAGNIFTWKGNLYTTNLDSEGLYSGFDSKLVNFLRGIK